MQVIARCYPMHFEVHNFIYQLVRYLLGITYMEYMLV